MEALMIMNPSDIQSTFASLGVNNGTAYKVSDNCHASLDEILFKLSTEDTTLRTFRRALGFSQVIKTDLLPLLIHVKDDPQTIAAIVRILVNLTIPVECLLPIEIMSTTDVGRHTIFEINKLLVSCKEAFVEPRTTKAVVEYIQQVVQKDKNTLTLDECENVNNCLLLLRNVLHIPEFGNGGAVTSHTNSVQNQILWNLFSQSIDKLLISLMTSQHKSYWGVTMVQLIALIYKDQHVGNMQKLLNMWFEASLSESSEDNESNTSPPDQGSGDSSPMLTSDPTSDSSDTGSSRKHNRMITHCTNNDNEKICTSNKQHIVRHHTHTKSSTKPGSKTSSEMQHKKTSHSRKNVKASVNYKERYSDNESGISSNKSQTLTLNRHSEKVNEETRDWSSSSDISDCGYATQADNQDQSISTSSNDDEGPVAKRSTKHVHQKPPVMIKTRYHAKHTTMLQDKKEWQRKKLGKRSRNTNSNMKALLHHTPSNEDISNLLKEFTVDFLLKGFGPLVQELHRQLLCNDTEVQIDTSHFFWLITYFLKFVAQLELDLDHISPVLTYDIISYLTYEGVHLYKQLEVASRLDNIDARSSVRRMHLVVTAIRELIQTLVTYRNISHLSYEDKHNLKQLQLHIGSSEDLKCLFVLLLEQYNPKIQTKQYLQDLIVTNHNLLQFLDDVTKMQDYNGDMKMEEHIAQFATMEVMCQYGLLLEDFQHNGPYINDCIFTMMHHVSGDLGQVALLFQPTILKTFSRVLEMDFEICEDWSDLIEYVMYKFINVPTQNALSPQVAALVEVTEKQTLPVQMPTLLEESSSPEWSKEDCDNLYWYYVQSSKCVDPVGEVKGLFCENGAANRTRVEIIQHLLTQNVIEISKYNDMMTVETVQTSVKIEHIFKIKAEQTVAARGVEPNVSRNQANVKMDQTPSSNATDEIKCLCNHLYKEKKRKSVEWIQNLLIETCHVKLNIREEQNNKSRYIMEPIPYHYTLMQQPIPIVPWNSEQKQILSCQPFRLLLHTLGIELPDEFTRIFATIPSSWSAETLFSLAEKLGPINTTTLKFDPTLLSGYCPAEKNEVTVVVEESKSTPSNFALHYLKPPPASVAIQFTPAPSSIPNWQQVMKKSKISIPTPITVVPTVLSVASIPSIVIMPPDSSVTEMSANETSRDTRSSLLMINEVVELEAMDQLSVCSVCITGCHSVTSELTQMCISEYEMGIANDSADELVMGTEQCRVR